MSEKKRKRTIGGLQADLNAANKEVESVMAECARWKENAATEREEGAGMEQIKVVQLARAIQNLGIVIQQVGQIIDMSNHNEFTDRKLRP